MQLVAFNWTVFSLTLAALFFFGVVYAFIVRQMSINNVTGQTAYMVVVGVGVALIASIPTFGLLTVAILFANFAACGLPMVVEYAFRVHDERRRDLEAANALAMKAINEAAEPTAETNENDDVGQTPDR